MGKNQRALLVVCESAYGGLARFKSTYNRIETAGLATVMNILRDDHMYVTSLTGSSATAANFVGSLANLAGKSRIKAVDVLSMLHGREYEICFRDKSLTGALEGTIRSQLGARNLGSKLRACFGTCCWDETVADDLKAAGFAVACGSKDVYANGAFGFPTALNSLERGDTFSTAAANAKNQAIMAACDAIARQLNPLFATADNYWTTSANRYAHITSLSG